jgi:hypothetical protein
MLESRHGEMRMDFVSNYKDLDFVNEHYFFWADEGGWDLDLDDYYKLQLEDNTISVFFDNEKFQTDRRISKICQGIIDDLYIDVSPEGVMGCFGEANEITNAFPWDACCDPADYEPEYAAKMAETFERLAAAFRVRSKEPSE